jgi:predicted RecB family nuclease
MSESDLNILTSDPIRFLCDNSSSFYRKFSLMRKQNGTFTFSPSDITTFLESPFASWMDRHYIENPEKYTIDESDESAELIQEKGNQHEKTVLELLRKEYSTIFTVPSIGSFQERHETTLAAMKTGEKVIYQAALSRDQFAGYADFLIRVEGKSKLGEYHYVAWDSKLARSTKPYFVIQLLCYSEMLEHIQGNFPEHIVVVLGNLERKTLKCNEFRDYFDAVKSRFLDFQKNFDPNQQPIPGQGEEIRRWSEEAKNVITRIDHLSKIANIRSTQIKKLEDAGIRTLKGFASTTVTKVKGMEDATFRKLKKQAELQVRSIGKPKPEYELIPNSSGDRKGLNNLPPHSPGDIYFDMEGYPLYDDKGLEYLFGLIIHEGKDTRFLDFWAHNRVQEKKAFEDFIDYVYARFKKYPDLHIYHYAAYEVTAVRRLSTQHGTREFEVDQLLRAELFIDLYKMVTQSLVVGEPSYSIKYIEHLYMEKRDGEVQNAAASLVEYAKYLNSPDGDSWKTSSILKGIRDYNEVDCVSTIKLTLWMRELQKAHGLKYVSYAASDIAEEPKVESEAEILAKSILDPLSNKTTLTETERVRKLLAELLQFHRREKKQYYWKYFERIQSTHEELADDSECIGCIEKAGEPTPVKKSMECVYTFDPAQDIKYSAGNSAKLYLDSAHIATCEITAISKDTGKLTVKLGPTAITKMGGEFPALASIMPGDPIGTEAIEEAILETVKPLAANQTIDSLRPAVRDFLLRSSPKASTLKTGDSVTLKDVINLEESSVCIQGPPGAGKTFSGSKSILELLKQGKKVGITSNTHQAIETLLLGVIKAAKDEKVSIKAYKSGGEDKEIYETLGIEHLKSNEIPGAEPSSLGGYVLGATAWGFAREDVMDQFDYLFIDEAGQVSLANFVAVSRCAKNLVLLGDQRQLEQPTQGSHPGESSESCLTYLIQEHATIPPSLGVFLDKTFRMRPSVCKFVSDSFYESRLRSDESSLKRELIVPSGLKYVTQSEGLLFIPETRGENSQSNPEEVETISKIIEELKACQFKNEKESRAIKNEDILVVAPYNLQGNLLKAKLPSGVVIGTVDKFQGGEAPVVILSMCSSSLDNAPRGIEFLFSPNRINVALSRAKCLAIVVANPNLKTTDATSIEKMRLVNLFCGMTKGAK